MAKVGTKKSTDKKRLCMRHDLRPLRHNLRPLRLLCAFIYLVIHLNNLILPLAEDPPNRKRNSSTRSPHH